MEPYLTPKKENKGEKRVENKFPGTRVSSRNENIFDLDHPNYFATRAMFIDIIHLKSKPRSAIGLNLSTSHTSQLTKQSLLVSPYLTPTPQTPKLHGLKGGRINK